MKGVEAFGHCAVCVETTVQPYRKSVPPERCNLCRAFEAGKQATQNDSAGLRGAADADTRDHYETAAFVVAGLPSGPSSARCPRPHCDWVGIYPNALEALTAGLEHAQHCEGHP